VIGATVFDAATMTLFVKSDYSGSSLPKVQCSGSTAGRPHHSPACHPTLVCCIEGMEVARHKDDQAASSAANLAE